MSSNHDNTLPTYDDTLPPPADVERVFLEHAGDDLTARTWLEDRGIDPAPIGRVAMLQYAFVWNPEAGRYDFRAYDAEHIGPKRSALAVPVIEDGNFVDLLLIGDDMSYETVSCRTPWLGRDNIKGAVRLHAHPLDFLEAGCTGCCHIALISRQALKELRGAKSVVCNCIWTAMDAWSWIEDYEPAEHLEFECEDTPGMIDQYFEADMDRRCAAIEREA